MAATLTTLNAALKRVYTPEKIHEQLYNETPFLSRVQKTDKYSIGELGRAVLHVSRNGAYTALPDGGGTLNTAGNQGYNKAEYTYAHHHQSIAIQGDVLDQSDSSSKSVANVATEEVNGAITDLKRNLQRQLFLNGDALICAAKTSDTNDVDVGTEGEQAIARGWIYEGMQFDLGTTTVEDDIVNGGTVTAVTGTDSFTSSTGAVTTEDANDFVSVKDARDGATSYEMNGLRNLVSTTTTVGGLAPGSVSIWKAANVDTTSQPLTLSLLLQQDQAIHQKTGSKADFVLFGLKQARKFYELLQQQVRFNGDSAIAAGDQSDPKWNNMTVFTDPDCWDTDAYFGQLKHLFMLEHSKPYWQNKVTGGDILTWAQGTDSYVAKVTYRAELGVRRRNAFARLGGLT